MADDLGAAKQLIAPAVVAVVVRVDDAIGRTLPDTRVLLDELARVRQIPERVDDQAAGAIDQAGVAGTQSTIFLQAGINVLRNLSELHGARIARLAVDDST